jgi:hypothetical protein
MQKRNILGVTSRYVIVLNQQGVGWCRFRPIPGTGVDDAPGPETRGDMVSLSQRYSAGFLCSAEYINDEHGKPVKMK